MVTKEKSLTTPNNIALLSSFINDHNSKKIAEEIFGLLNKSPDEIITHFIAEKNFSKAMDLIEMFFPKSKKDISAREEYYGLICEQIFTILKQIGGDNTEEIKEYYLGHPCILYLVLHSLFDYPKDKSLFLVKLHRFCIELLETHNIYADQVVLDMMEYFGERREIGGEKKRQEFLLNAPSALMKGEIEKREVTEDDSPFTKIIESAEKLLPEGDNLRDNEQLSIFYDEEKGCVSIKPNKDIAYRIVQS